VSDRDDKWQTLYDAACARADAAESRVAELEGENERLTSLVRDGQVTIDVLRRSNKSHSLDRDEAKSHARVSADQRRGAEAEVTKLRMALGWFLEDERFVVSVGGNPNVVDKMLADARAALTVPVPSGEKTT